MKMNSFLKTLSNEERRILPVLIDVGVLGDPLGRITYEWLGIKTGLSHQHDLLGQFLGPLSQKTYEHFGIVISSIVVGAGTKEPSYGETGGFYAYIQTLDQKFLKKIDIKELQKDVWEWCKKVN